jgi:adenylate kinase
MANLIVLHGTPGAGKGTQSDRLIGREYNGLPVFHISAGDRIRDINASDNASIFTQEVRAGLANGNLSDELVNCVVFEKVAEFPQSSIVVMDGYPTKPSAIEGFYKAVDQGGHKLLGGILLEVSQETSFKRLTERGTRGGNELEPVITPEKAEKRYKVFREMTLPTMNLIEKRAQVIRINAESDANEVWYAFESQFNKLASFSD